MRPQAKLITFVFICIVAPMFGCATPPLVKNMIPSLNTFNFPATDKTIKIAEVRGGEKTNPLGIPKIENEGFQEALIKTLEKSGIFKQVLLNQNVDYILYAEIISQKHLGTFSLTQTLFVNYILIKAETNKEVWKENIYSQFDAKFGVAFQGSQRLKRAQEGAIRDNLTQLLIKLSEVLKQSKLK